MPGLVWNTMMSMSGGWFFVVASEAITVGDTTVTLPGVGAYVATAIKQQNLPAVGYAVLAMLAVIIIYDQLLFRPIVAWADKFRFEQTASAEAPSSWLLDLFRQTRFLRTLASTVAATIESTTRIRIPLPELPKLKFELKIPGPTDRRDLDRHHFSAARSGSAGASSRSSPRRCTGPMSEPRSWTAFTRSSA